MQCPSHAATEHAAFDPQIPLASLAQAQEDGAQCGLHLDNLVVSLAGNNVVKELLEGQVPGWEVYLVDYLGLT